MIFPHVKQGDTRSYLCKKIHICKSFHQHLHNLIVTSIGGVV